MPLVGYTMHIWIPIGIVNTHSHSRTRTIIASDEDMEAVQKRGVLCNIGSLSRLRKHAKNFPGEKVCIRFNPNVTAGEHEIVQTGTPKCKFGIALHNAGEVAKIVREHKLRVVGIHQHTGSGIDDPASIIAAVESLVSTLSFFDLAQLQFVDIGGGFKVKYKPDDHAVNLPAVAKEIDRVFTPLCAAHARALATKSKTKSKTSRPRLQLYLEPGKFLVAECGHLLVKVNTVKRRRDRVILGTDSGFGHLLRPILYQAITLTRPNAVECESVMDLRWAQISDLDLVYAPFIVYPQLFTFPPPNPHHSHSPHQPPYHP